MSYIYPDLEWYSSQSERKGLPGRCPHANIHRCPRYFYSTALLSDAGITTKIPKELHDTAYAKWRAHELAPATDETATSIFGGKNPDCYSNFCPEVAYTTFKLFGSKLISIGDEIDHQIAERAIAEYPAPEGKDWRRSWGHVEPLHFSDCPLYANLHQEKSMSNITFNGPVTGGNINVAGHSINAQAMSFSVAELSLKLKHQMLPRLRRKRRSRNWLSFFLIRS